MLDAIFLYKRDNSVLKLLAALEKQFQPPLRTVAVILDTRISWRWNGSAQSYMIT